MSRRDCASGPSSKAHVGGLLSAELSSKQVFVQPASLDSIVVCSKTQLEEHAAACKYSFERVFITVSRSVGGSSAVLKDTARVSRVRR